MTKKVLLKYTADKVNEPILASVIRETGALINILTAEISPSGGEMLLTIHAPEGEIARIVDLFEQKGVRVLEFRRAIEFDEEKCFHCGACISLCPTGALRLAEDYSLKLDEEKCIYCEICVPSCPVKALKISKF